MPWPPSFPIKPGMTNSPENLSHETRPLVATTIVARLNARVAVHLVVERATLRALPARRTVEYEELPARVSKYAVLTVRGAQYSASSQLVGQRLTVRLYTDPIECWLGGARVLERARLRDGQRHPRDIGHPNRSFSSGRAPQGEGPRCVRTH